MITETRFKKVKKIFERQYKDLSIHEINLIDNFLEEVKINLVDKLVETTNKQPYLVHRPYCTPNNIVINAKSKEDVVKKSHKNFGFCSDTTAELSTKKVIVLKQG